MGGHTVVEKRLAHRRLGVARLGDGYAEGRMETPMKTRARPAGCVPVLLLTFLREFNGRKVHPPEGISLRPALMGKALKRRQPLFWEHEGNRAVRAGKRVGA